MSTPGIFPIEIYKGDDFELKFRLKDSFGVYINLTGWTGRAQLRNVSGPTGILAASFAVAIGNQGTEPGSIIVTMPAVTTAALTLPLGVYDVEMTSSAPSKITTYLVGPATIIDDVTRT